MKCIVEKHAYVYDMYHGGFISYYQVKFFMSTTINNIWCNWFICLIFIKWLHNIHPVHPTTTYVLLLLH